jgi:hypothetical protein
VQDQIYATSLDLVKPSIVQVISRYVLLRRTGKEYTGHCPFHDDKHPSFSVSEEKGLFHCFGCQQSGDVFDFVMEIDGVTFPQALAGLGMNTARPARRAPRSDALAVKARELATWANEMTHKAEALLREIGAEIYICSVARRQSYTDKKLIVEHEAALLRQWAILEDIADDLQDENAVLELYRQRETIENILSGGLVDG